MIKKILLLMLFIWPYFGVKLFLDDPIKFLFYKKIIINNTDELHNTFNNPKKNYYNE